MLFDQEWQVLRHMPTPVSFDGFQRLAEASRVVDKLEFEKAMNSLTEQRCGFQQRRHADERPVSNQTLNSMAGGQTARRSTAEIYAGQVPAAQPARQGVDGYGLPGRTYDDVSTFDQVLTSEEIADIYLAGTTEKALQSAECGLLTGH